MERLRGSESFPSLRWKILLKSPTKCRLGVLPIFAVLPDTARSNPHTPCDRSEPMPGGAMEFGPDGRRRTAFQSTTGMATGACRLAATARVDTARRVATGTAGLAALAAAGLNRNRLPAQTGSQRQPLS